SAAMAPGLQVVVEPCLGTEFAVLLGVAGMVVAERDEGGSADGNGVCPERHRLGDIGAGADAAGHDQLHVVMHAELLQCLHRLRNRGEGGNADVFDKHVCVAAVPPCM